jgi:hypothetical protein
MRWKWIPVFILFLSLSACGSPEPEPETMAEDPSTEPVVTEEQATAQAEIASNAICQNPPPDEIALGSKVEGSIEDPVWLNCYWVEVPDGLDSVTFNLSGLTADLTMYAGYGFVYTLQTHTGEFYSSREDGTADEQIVVEKPKPGPYFIKVQPQGPKVSSPYALGVTTQPETTAPLTGQGTVGLNACARPAIELALGDSIDGELEVRSESPWDRDYYCLQVPDGMDSVTFQLTNLTGNIDLIVRNLQGGFWADRVKQLDDRIITLENPAPGPYYIDAGWNRINEPSTYTITVSGQ